MRYASLFFQNTSLSSVDVTLLSELLLLSLAVVAVLWLLRAAWRFLSAVVSSMANMLSWALALAAVVFLVVRLVGFLA